MKKLITMIVTISVLLTMYGQALADKTTSREAARRPAAKAKSAPTTVVFDLGHHEIFSPVKEGPLNYTMFNDQIKKSGESVGTNSGPVTKAALKGVKTYIIAGPVQALTPDEVAALEGFVKGGGNLLVLLHISFPLAQLTDAFGIIVSNFTIGEAAGLIDGKSQDFLVTRFGQHAVTTGVEKVAVYGTWGLMANEPAKVIASTSEKAWADMNRDRTLNAGEPVQDFGIVAVNQPGKGKVVVVADDAPFANRFIDEADNRRLAENIIKWFKR